MYRFILVGLLSLCMFWLPTQVMSAGLPLGVHLMEPNELEAVLPYRGESDEFFVTVPMVITDRRKGVWENFFKTADLAKITPMVRWVTVFEDNSWRVPNRKEIIEVSTFMSSLNWPGRKIIILFNEPNHAKEWGDTVDPSGYAKIALFAVNWLKTEKPIFEVLPAGLDAAASNSKITMDSLVFMEKMFKARPELFEMIDGWTSHSYPNPDFSSTPYRIGKNSLRGFKIELDKLKVLTGREFDIYITETGWKQSKLVSRNIMSYYKYAAENVWDDPSVKAVTVFVLKGFNGPFADFSLLDSELKPTAQMKALQSIMSAGVD